MGDLRRFLYSLALVVVFIFGSWFLLGEAIDGFSVEPSKTNDVIEHEGLWRVFHFIEGTIVARFEFRGKVVQHKGIDGGFFYDQDGDMMFVPGQFVLSPVYVDPDEKLGEMGPDF